MNNTRACRVIVRLGALIFSSLLLFSSTCLSCLFRHNVESNFELNILHHVDEHYIAGDGNRSPSNTGDGLDESEHGCIVVRLMRDGTDVTWDKTVQYKNSRYRNSD